VRIVEHNLLWGPYDVLAMGVGNGGVIFLLGRCESSRCESAPSNLIEEHYWAGKFSKRRGGYGWGKKDEIGAPGSRADGHLDGGVPTKRT